MSQTIYIGPSAINNDPIRAVITIPCVNSKLTDRLDAEVVQLWILHHEVSPVTAMSTGQDEAICGTCPLRSWRDGVKVPRLCYVNPLTAQSVWRHSHANEVVTPKQVVKRSRANLLRLGAYGDPAALPYDLVLDLCEQAQAAGIKRRTGYTHMWRTADQRFRHLIMASCEGTQESLQAQAMGWRTFAVKLPGSTPDPRAIVCPASDEAGAKTVCERCGLCDGVKVPTSNQTPFACDSRRSITINVHGTAQSSKERHLAALLNTKEFA